MNSPLVGPNQMTQMKLRIIRYAMLAFILGFGGFAYWTSTHRTEAPNPETNIAMIRWLGFGMLVAAVFAVVFFRSMRAKAEGAQRLTWSLIGSAMAEGTALFGAVIMFLGGDIWVYALALLLFLGTWGALPDDPDVA
jgi:FtsH-binding integral membrane protein